jgi:hypothetical protein
VNLIPLAALLVAALALATSITAIVLVERLRRARPVRQRQTAGAHSVQMQSGGTLIIPSGISADGREMKIDLTMDPVENARRVSDRMGRHL